MPEMGGIALFHAMRDRNANIPMVLMTGHPMGEEVDKLQSQGLLGWALKPFSLKQLSLILARALSGWG
jgi:DNA-binding NtrC family response regulator